MDKTLSYEKSVIVRGGVFSGRANSSSEIANRPAGETQNRQRVGRSELL